MDKEGGQKAIAGLHGVQLHGSPKPLAVLQYVSDSIAMGRAVTVFLGLYRCLRDVFYSHVPFQSVFHFPPEITGHSLSLAPLAEPLRQFRQPLHRGVRQSEWSHSL